MRKALLAMLLLLSSAADAQWREGGDVVPDNAWRKSSGSFGALLEFTAKPDELFEAWNRPGVRVEVPASVDEARRGEILMGVVLFTGCKADANGNCDASVDYLILRPDGSVYGDLKDGDLWKDKPAPAASEIQLCAQPLGIRIEPTDPIGEYTVKATLRDRNAGIAMELIRTFRVLEAAGSGTNEAPK